MRTDSLHQSDAPLGLTCLVLLIAYMCAYPHAAWKSTSAPLFFRTSGKVTVENLKISRGQLAPCQENRIKRQQTVSSAECKVLALNAGCLLASMPSYCRFRPIECCYSQSVSVSVPQDKIQGSAIATGRSGPTRRRATRFQEQRATPARLTTSCPHNSRPKKPELAPQDISKPAEQALPNFRN